MRAVETGCWCWCWVPGAGAGAGAVSWLCAWCCRVPVLVLVLWRCELAVRVVETGCRCWVLVVRMVETAGAGAAGAEVPAVMGRMNL